MPHGTRHPVGPLTVAFPPGADVRPGAGGALVGWEPGAAPEGVRARIAAYARPARDGEDARAATAGALDDLARQLEDLVVLDLAEAPLAGTAGTRVLLHHATDGVATCSEQWRVAYAGAVVTLEATCGALDYDTLAPAFAATAASLG